MFMNINSLQFKDFMEFTKIPAVLQSTVLEISDATLIRKKLSLLIQFMGFYIKK